VSPPGKPFQNPDKLIAGVSVGVCFSGSAELVQFAVPDNYHPVCEYDSVDFMLDVTVTERYDGLFHTLINYCDRILADTDLLARFQYFHVIRASLSALAVFPSFGTSLPDKSGGSKLRAAGFRRFKEQRNRSDLQMLQSPRPKRHQRKTWPMERNSLNEKYM